MSIQPAFFRSAPAKRLLDRTAKIAAAPMTLHHALDNDNELPILRWGGCEACAFVASLPDGTGTCRASRRRAAALAKSQDVPVTFVCHLGFTCVSVPPIANSDYTITLGPYIPAETDHDIAFDVTHGLRALLGSWPKNAPLPFELSDVRSVPGGTVSAVAEWTMEALRETAAAVEAEEAASNDEDAANMASPESKPKIDNADSAAPTHGYSWTSLAALALLCGHSRIVRTALKDRLEEVGAAPNASHETARAFLVQATSKLLETARMMGGATENAQAAYPAFVAEVSANRTTPEMLAAAMRVLRRVRPNNTQQLPDYLPRLVDVVYKQYKHDLMLGDIANTFGLAPSTITRALARRVNGAFCEYLGRVRMEQACRLLRTTRLSADAVGKRVGIRDQSNFGKLFKRYVGMTPGRYRKRYQNKTTR